VHAGRNTKLKQNAPFGLAKYFLTMEQLSLDTVHEMNLIELKQIGTPFEFDKKNVNLRLNLVF
jgi:hypothetical protein